MPVIEWTNLIAALNQAALDVRIKAQSNLTKTRAIKQNDGSVRNVKQSSSGGLLRSLRDGQQRVVVKSNRLSIQLAPNMSYYGYFIDQGVKGLKKGPSKKTPYSFKSAGVGEQMMRSLMKWMRYKRIRLRDSKGKFKKGKASSKSYESLAYVIGRSIKQKGIARSEFLSEPIAMVRQQMPAIINNAIAADIDNFMNQLFKES